MTDTTTEFPAASADSTTAIDGADAAAGPLCVTPGRPTLAEICRAAPFCPLAKHLPWAG